MKAGIVQRRGVKVGIVVSGPYMCQYSDEVSVEMNSFVQREQDALADLEWLLWQLGGHQHVAHLHTIYSHLYQM